MRRSLATTVCAIAVFAACGDTEARPPNVVVLLADDLGWADLGVQGSPDVVTPHIDSIARNGVRFTAGYVTSPQCSPSRAGLITGRYQSELLAPRRCAAAQTSGATTGVSGNKGRTPTETGTFRCVR
jgi:hypothetical protein